METWLLEIGYEYSDYDNPYTRIEVQELYVGSKECAKEYGAKLFEEYKLLMEERKVFSKATGEAWVYVSPDGRKCKVRDSNEPGWTLIKAGLDPIGRGIEDEEAGL